MTTLAAHVVVQKSLFDRPGRMISIKEQGTKCRNVCRRVSSSIRFHDRL
jgi:hypothetical protein